MTLPQNWTKPHIPIKVISDPCIYPPIPHWGISILLPESPLYMSNIFKYTLHISIPYMPLYYSYCNVHLSSIPNDIYSHNKLYHNHPYYILLNLSTIIRSIHHSLFKKSENHNKNHPSQQVFTLFFCVIPLPRLNLRGFLHRKRASQMLQEAASGSSCPGREISWEYPLVTIGVYPTY